MPKQVSTSSLAARIKAKAKKAFDAAKTAEPTYDTGGNLPTGIEGGIAQLVDCCVKKIKGGKSNAGELMFFAAGVVVSPEEVNGVHIKGLRTSIMEPLYDTPTRGRKTFGEHLDWVLNEMKKLGADLSEVSEDELEGVMADLKEAKPYFRFRTWSGSKQEIVKDGNKWKVGDKSYLSEAAAKAANPYAGREPTVNNTWGGTKGLEDYVSEEPEGAVVDETTSDAAEEAEEAEEAAAEVEEGGDNDLSELAEQADGGDEDAQRELEKLAKAADVDAANIATWAEVAEAIQAAGSGEEAEEAEEEAEEAEPTIPNKGDVYSFKAKGKKKAVDHEVVAVLPKAKTVTLKNLDDGSMLKGIAWSELVG